MDPITFSANDFTIADFDEGRMPFEPNDYSLLKFGCDATARKFGWNMAEAFFGAHRDLLMKRQAIVVPSPYNTVPNAAMVMVGHMIQRLNHLLADAGGQPVEFSYIRRKLTFTTDYGFLSKEERVQMLTKDEMYLNDTYLDGKTIIFADDIRITGTNELCMDALLRRHPRFDDADVVYLYFARLVGEGRPDVEAALNLSSIQTLRDYAALCETPNHHVIVRPIKFALSRPADEFIDWLGIATDATLLAIYYGGLAEGYFDAKGFTQNFAALKDRVTQRGLLSIPTPLRLVEAAAA